MIRKNRENKITKIVETNPGIQFREIMRSSGLKNGVLSHYLDKLEKKGTIKADRGPRQARFFPPKVSTNEFKVFKALRRQTSRDLLHALLIEEGLEFTQLVEKAKKSPSTVSFYLSQMIEDEIIETKTENFKKRFYIRSKEQIDKLIEDYRPGLLEKPTSGFEDIFNSL